MGSALSTSGLRYFDVSNTSNAANAHGSILRLITSNAAATGTTSVDIVKYKDGNFYINNNESSGSTNFYTGGSTRVTIDSSGNLKFNSGYGSVATAFGVRAWADIYWNSGTPTARANGNVNSISDDGTGDMTISFSTAMPDTNYSCLVSGDDYGNSQYPGFNVGSTSRGKTTGGVTLNATQKDGTARDIAAVNFAVIR